ncbi:MAG: malto-oligosyltrehalose trehalohydrolase [Egibacteraceae bacterium]
MIEQVTRRLPVGAEPAPGGVHFRVWAPRRRSVEVVLFDAPAEELPVPPGACTWPLEPEPDGWFSGLVPDTAPGALYAFRLDGRAGGDVCPDPASRFQPAGPFGPSQVVDPASFAWGDEAWAGLAPHEHVLYELHVGTFTPEGTWKAAEAELAYLAEVGVTTLEVMPVADFAGRFGWGYDGVDLFAPTRLYGHPDDMRGFVDAAHRLGLAVILDVVYNHLGPAGCVLERFAADYFTDRYENEWGVALNFDGPSAGPVRDFFAANAAYWISEFHLDGLRLDATQSVCDASPEHVLAAIGRAARQAAGDRPVLLMAENEPQDSRVLRSPAEGGYGLDAAWNEDFHRSAVVAATGRNEAYYSDYLGTPQELVSAVKRGYLYQGQYYLWQGRTRGSPALDLSPRRFVHYLQNHDQVGNTLRGERLHRFTSPGRLRALTALLLLSPPIPLLFQGQEFAASSPFTFFADHGADLAALVREGRAEHLRQFPSLADPSASACLANPGDPATFERCRLDHDERDHPLHREVLALHRDLLRLRRQDPVLSDPEVGVDGAVLGPEAFGLRFFATNGHDRLLVVNLGRDLPLRPNPEPLLAPPAGTRWAALWASEDPRYGGGGVPELAEMAAGQWPLPGHSALLLGWAP